jgi:tetratricopeptide (TPR) repeat protein
MLGIPDASRAEGYRPWLPALLSGGELYLFDTRLGLPIPGPDGQPVATLKQVATDDALLRALDVEGEPYPVQASDLEKVTALIEGSPAYLSRRMRQVELRLAGERKLVLTVAASTLADRLRACEHVDDARLWELPYQGLVQQGSPVAQAASARELEPYHLELFPNNLRPMAAVLQQGRVMQIRGNYAQDDDARASSANALLQMARVPDDDLARLKLTPQERYLVDHTKQDASYWLGLVAFERGRYAAAVEHLRKRTLEASPDGPWTAGARYNLARCYEALGRDAEAVELYESDTSPQRAGNLLRARRLTPQSATTDESTAPAENAATDEPATPADPAAPDVPADPAASDEPATPANPAASDKPASN